MSGWRGRLNWLVSGVMAFYFVTLGGQLLGLLPLSKAQAAAGDVTLLWDSADGSIPSGWTCVSCVSGDPYFGVFPRGRSTYSSTMAGADTATHTLTFSSATAGAATSNAGSGTAAPSGAHTHSWGNPTVDSPDIKPPYKHLQFIRKSNPQTLPANAIAMFDVASILSLPVGWSHYSAMDGNYLRGGNDNVTGGAATHSHTTGAVTSGSAANAIPDPGNGLTIAGASHSHSLAAQSLVGNNDPSYIEVVFAKATAAGDIPSGLIGLFDNSTLPTNWSLLSTNGSVFDGKLIKGASSYSGTAGGNETHDHGGSATFTSGGPSGTLNSKTSTGANTQPTSTHTHNVSYTVSSSSSMPVYRDTILAKYDPTVSVYEQSAYRFFEDTGTTAVINPLAALNTDAALVATGQAFRLRLLLHVSAVNLGLSGQSFKLRFASKTGASCGDDEAYADVTTTSAISYDNNTLPGDGDALTANLTDDPTHGSDTVRNQTYEELNNFTNSQAAVNKGEDGKWDFALIDNGATSNTRYCLKATKSDGTDLDIYSVQPEILTAGNVSLDQTAYRWRNDDGYEGTQTATKYLHPTADGTYATSWTQTGCTANFDCVNDQASNGDEGTPDAHDSDTTKVSIDALANTRLSFQLKDSAIPASSTVTQLIITTLSGETGASGPDPTIQSFYRLGGVDTDCASGTVTGGTAFTQVDCTFSSLSLTATDLDNLEIGFMETGGRDLKVTQAYVQVSYTLLGGTYKQPENTLHTGQAKSENLRLRVLVKNGGPDAADSVKYRLQYAAKGGGTCAAPTDTYTGVPPGSGSATITTTTAYYASRDASTNVSGALTDPASHTFVAGQLIEDPDNDTTALTLAASQFTEIEYVFQFTTTATDGETYCFRVVRNGQPMSTYANYAEITLTGGGAETPTTEQLMRHGNWFNSSGVEQSYYW